MPLHSSTLPGSPTSWSISAAQAALSSALLRELFEVRQAPAACAALSCAREHLLDAFHCFQVLGASDILADNTSRQTKKMPVAVPSRCVHTPPPSLPPFLLRMRLISSPHLVKYYCIFCPLPHGCGQVLDVIERLFVHIFDGLKERYSKELEAINKQYPFEPLQVRLTLFPVLRQRFWTWFLDCLE